ncbi:MAG: UbiA family prenyltransferase [Alphaproteobacteria bacterium]
MSAAAPFAQRLWTYQAERFPVFRHGALIAAFGGSAPCLSALLRGPGELPTLHAVIVSIICLFLFFFQLRVADEHKDAEDDRKYRPERAVPRGLISLKELRTLGFGAAAIQAVLVATLYLPLLAFLALVWAWMVLMTAEFFVPVWLRARPILYMVSHMIVMPLIDLFATATDWLPAGVEPHGAFGAGLGAFLLLSFCNGAAIEIARKSWAPEDERPGVETYSKLWSPHKAGLVAATIMWAGLACAAFVHAVSGAHVAFLIALIIGAGAGVGAAYFYAAKPTHAAAKRLENFSGLWVLASYMCLGVLPMGLRLWTG